MLNMRYLDPLTDALATIEDRRPLVRLVRDSAVVRSLKNRGYEFILVGSGFDVTPDDAPADKCINCGPTFPGLFETALLSVTPLRGMGLWGMFYDAHRARIASSIDYMHHLGLGGARPKFVFAHLMIPHPPFLMGAAASRANPRRAFEILDEALYRGDRAEYLDGYRAQASYAIQQTSSIVRQARSGSGRRLVVIVNGDHGPGSRFDLATVTAEGVNERLTILLATSFPDGTLHEEIQSPVNLYRGVFNAVFHSSMPLLPDRSLIPLPGLPYLFRDVTELHPRVARPEPTSPR